MKVAYAVVLLAVITAVVSDSSRQTPPPIPVLDDPVQNHQFKSEYSDRLAKTAAFGGPKSPGTLQEVQKSSIPALPLQGYPAPEAVRPYPAQSYQFGSEYSGVYSRSAFAPKSAAGPSSYGVYQPYQQHQQYNFGPYQQFYPGAGYPAAVGSYPTAYSSQPAAGAAYPTPYSAYPFAAQPYGGGGSYSPSYPSAYPTSSAYPSYYGGQFAGPSASPYAGQYSSASSQTATPYTALPSAYQHQQLRSSFYNSPVDGPQFPYPHHPQQYQSQQYPSSLQYPSQQYPSHQYPSFNQNSPAAPTVSATADPAKASSSEKK